MTRFNSEKKLDDEMILKTGYPVPEDITGRHNEVVLTVTTAVSR